MIEDVLRYPQRGDGVTETLAIGTALQSFWLLLFPVVFVVGYLVNVMRQTYADEAEPPAFENVERLARDGVVGSAILFVYLLIPVVVAGTLAVVTSSLGVASGREDAALVGIVLSALLAVVVGGVLALAFGYVGLAALANFAARDSVGAAFAVGDLAEIVIDTGFLKGWLVGLGALFLGAMATTAVNTVLGIAFGVFGIVPIVGILVGLVGTVVQWLVASAIGFYCSVSAYRAVARGFLDAGTSQAV